MSSPSRKSAASYPLPYPGCFSSDVVNDGEAMFKRHKKKDQTADSEHDMERCRPFGIRKVIDVPHDESGHYHNVTCNQPPNFSVMTLNQGSAVKSMDFHPLHLQLILLLVGTNTGDVMVWALGNKERIASKNFKVWDLAACSVGLQASLADDETASVNRVMWSPDGTLFGVAYSKHIVHIYSYHGGDDIRNHLEIEAHVGSVNDLAFSYPNKQLCVVTCGEDKLIKVWDAVTGNKQFTFEGHEAPVYSVCPHDKEAIQSIFSIATDGKIKTWLYDTVGFGVDFAAGHSSTTMAFSPDGKRLFSCGTNKDGKSHLVEWDRSRGMVTHVYPGLAKQSVGVVQFDASTTRILAAGDEFMLKLWDMDGFGLMTSIDVDGALPASPCIRFNKDGSLLAVSTNDNCVKVLANCDGFFLVTKVGNREHEAWRAALERRDNPALADESDEKSRIWKAAEINEPSQCQSLRLHHDLTAVRVARLMYTNSGKEILVLVSNGVHKTWKWPMIVTNITGKATTSLAPYLCRATPEQLMINDMSDKNPDEACFALSKNDRFLMSASGGKTSLYSMCTAERITTLPAATFLAFHPQDNKMLAIGMEDFSIQIYNFKAPRNPYGTPYLSQVKNKLSGHQERITGLAFSSTLNILVSSGADSQLCVWNTDGWEKQVSKSLQIPSGRPTSNTRVQFHIDGTHLLAVHETQIAVYNAPKLECLKQWFPRDANPITDATYSCDSQLVYVGFEDGSVGVLTAPSLTLQCTIGSNAYLRTPNPSLKVYPLQIEAHPSKPNQFALALTDGVVCVLEP